MHTHWERVRDTLAFSTGKISISRKGRTGKTMRVDKLKYTPWQTIVSYILKVV